MPWSAHFWSDKSAQRKRLSYPPLRMASARDRVVAMLTIPAQRAVFFGDWHGDLAFAAAALADSHAKLEADVYFHAGDFGLWPADNEECWQPDYLPGLERLLAAQDRTLFFVDGNHEEHRWLATFPLNENGLRPISEHIVHIPRGAALMVGSKKLVGLGGARSVDRGLRTFNETWFLEEMITDDDYRKAVAHGAADILLTHERPFEGDLVRHFDFLTKMDNDGQRRFVANAADRLSVQLLVHGHHHHRYTATDAGYTIEGLACNVDSPTQADFEANRVVIEVA